jgi:DNA-binding NarL/FixJ family response regulator
MSEVASTLNWDEFIKLLQGLERGDPPMSAAVMASLINYVAQQNSFNDALDENLTEREIELLGHLGLGLPNKAIAEQLGVSENTVKYHIKNILQKLYYNNRAEAATYAVRHNLISKI